MTCGCDSSDGSGDGGGDKEVIIHFCIMFLSSEFIEE